MITQTVFKPNYALKHVVFFGALALILVLSACSAATAITDEQSAADVTAVPTPWESPLVAPDHSAAIERAMLVALTAQGAPTENARIDVQKVADGYARVAVYYDSVNRPDVWDPGYAYFEDGVWKSWGFGSGISQEHVEAAGIPRSVWPEVWLQPNAGPTAGNP